MQSRLARTGLSGNTRRSKASRAIIFVVLVISAGTCLAPGLYASTDCDRWIKEYRQGLLQARAARRLRLAKARLLVAVQRPHPAVAHHPTHHRMSPLESLRRFQVDCGELETPPSIYTAMDIPLIPVETLPLETTTIAELAKPAFVSPAVPNLVTPLMTVATDVPSDVPEPGSLLLVLTGTSMAAEAVRRRRAK